MKASIVEQCAANVLAGAETAAAFIGSAPRSALRARVAARRGSCVNTYTMVAATLCGVPASTRGCPRPYAVLLLGTRRPPRLEDDEDEVGSTGRGEAGTA